MDLGQLRKEYTRSGLERDMLAAEPVEQFERWLKQAMEAGIIEPNAMSLTTASPEGRPTLRTVLLKLFDREGFVFFTNLESTKARQIAANPHVALLFPWVALERQVIITGTAHRISAAESLKYFLTRPRGSQLGAWVSPQSRVIESRTFLERKFEEVKQRFGNGEIPLPSFWGGFRVVPQTVEFWQGRESRLHDRFLYTRQAEGVWQLERLAP